jgi:tetratricopeptide (TPR) repeat protein
MALAYFGQMGTLSWPADNIVNSGALDDPDKSIRLAAVEALARTAKAAHAERLYERLNPTAEPSEDVRTAAWNALAVLFPREFDVNQLNQWAQRFLDAPQRRLTILEALRNKLTETKSADELAVVQQNIGAVYMDLKQYGQAARAFEKALEAPRQQNQVKDFLVTQLLQAYLLGKNYERATQFGAQLIGEAQQYQSKVGVEIVREAQRLSGEGQAEDALRLTGLALKMDPPLAEQFAGSLRKLDQQLRAADARPATAPAAQ